VQVSGSESVRAKEVLVQHVLDVTCVTPTRRRNAAAVKREWLQVKCSLPQRQVARADALHALSTGDVAARGQALLDADLDEDAIQFAQRQAGPQFLSWKSSSKFGAWLAKCPCVSHPDVALMHVRRHLLSVALILSRRETVIEFSQLAML
jgi:hypothetical protein